MARAAYTLLALLVTLPLGAELSLAFECSQVADLSANVFVATVIATDDRGSTHANPPRVTLAVERRVSGTIGRGKVHAFWRPVRPSEQCGTRSLESAEPVKDPWPTTPMIGPKPGERLLLMGWYVDSQLQVNATCAVPGTAENVKEVQELHASIRKRKKEDARRHEAHLEEERRIHATADVAALFRSADVVVLAKRSSSGPNGRITIQVLRTFKDPLELRAIERHFAIAIVTDADPRLRTRLESGDDVILFLRILPGKAFRDGSAPTATFFRDDRNLVPVDPVAGVLTASQAILDRLSAESSLRAAVPWK